MTTDQEDLQRALGRVEGKIDMLIDSQRAGAIKCSLCEIRFDKLEGAVSLHRNILYGLAAVASFLGVERVAKYLQVPFLAH